MTTKSAMPGWPDAGAFPFLPFNLPGAGQPNAGSGFLQGMSGGVDLLKEFWGKLPGGTQLPGFMVPTLDVDELDRRIGDLKAAESWVEINLNLLRATIQGLEVQRNTIAAIQSLSAMAGASGQAAPPWPQPQPQTPVAAPAPVDPPVPAPEPAPADPAAEPATPAAANWLGLLQDQFARVAEAALAPAARTAPAAAKAPAKAAGRRPATKRRTTARSKT